VVQVEDLVSDPRWPEYGPKAAAAFGLAYQFRAEPHARGALNLYANQAYQIDVDARMLGAMFAQMVAVAMGWGRQYESMRQAIGTREQIGQAIGILMERYQLDSDRAFAFLTRVSQAGNIKLRDVAAGVIADTAGKAR
jgi:hypothetical protein